jgi:two-component system sensor histidine kinase KdpD
MISRMFNTHIRPNAQPVTAAQTSSDDMQNTYTPFINQECVAIPDLIDRLLELSRIQAGTIDLYLEPTQLSDVFQASIDQLQAIASQHKLSIDIGADVLPVMADAFRVQQVLLALVENAAKYSREGSTIWISAYRQGSSIQINVCDQGIGIAPEDQERVFEAYRQPEYQMTNRAGLGLAISKGLVEMLGGRIWATDRPRKNFRTMISFTLPIVTASNWNRALSRHRRNSFVSESLVAEPYLRPV